MLFYLGTHRPGWLSELSVPLFVSARTLGDRRVLPRALGRWALDSGGFSELSLFGSWRTTAAEYARRAERYRVEVGGLDWAAPQDWMCEPELLKRTGLSVAEHQRRTLASFLELRELAPSVPWIPVLQGWTRGEYLDHVASYLRAGVDLFACGTVGIGSVCRRQATIRAGLIVHELAREGLRLHGFGFKRTGLSFAASALASSDSLAWSFHARKERASACDHAGSCANCSRFALAWRAETMRAIGGAS